MARAEVACFCDVVRADLNGKVTLLGAMFDVLFPPSLPFHAQFNFVARLAFDESERGPHSVTAELETLSGDEVLYRDQAAHDVQRANPMSEGLPITMNLALPMSIQFRRAGLYRMVVRVDGDEVVSLGLKLMPQVPTP